jgi:hypothetical protein
MPDRHAHEGGDKEMALLMERRSDISPDKKADVALWLGFGVSEDLDADVPPSGITWYRIDVTAAEEAPTLAPVEAVAAMGVVVDLNRSRTSLRLPPARQAPAGRAREGRSDPEWAEARDWAKKQGIKVASKGRLPRDVINQYRAALLAEKLADAEVITVKDVTPPPAPPAKVAAKTAKAAAVPPATFAPPKQ